MTQTFSRSDPFAADAGHQPLQDAPGGFGNAPGTGAPETLDQLGHALLDACRAAAVTKGITLPGRQSVYMAPIPADCEQVAVLFTGWDPTPAQDGNTTMCRPWRWMANFSLIITRCTPAIPGKGKALSTVTAAQLNAAARLASDDAEVLLETMNHLGEVGTATSITTNAPSGGFQTVELNVPLVSGGSFL